MKRCLRCKISYPTTFFFKQRDKKDGLRPYCKGCVVVMNRPYIRKWQRSNIIKYGIGTSTISRFGLKLALFIYDRSGRKCEICSEENDLTIHHIDGVGRHSEEKGIKANNNPNNLQVLCRRCHGRIEGRKGQGIKHRRC